MIRWMLTVAAVACGLPRIEAGEIIARCGRGYLERVDGHLVVHLKGSPYEMGFQHGALLSSEAKALVHHLFDVRAKDQKVSFMGMKVEPKQVVQSIVKLQQPYVPERFREELRGLSAGSGVPLADVTSANFIPELFHCSGFALLADATADRQVLHGRVLDYAVDWRLQEYAVLVVAEPDGKIPFANVTYAGFVGSVTGMNAEQVSFGEMGGSGLFLWHGTPMSLLMRRGLEEAHNLEEAIDIFQKSKRTCEYYYVFADGKNNRAAGIDGSALRFEVIPPGAKHARLPTPVPNTVLLSAGKRYENLCSLVSKVQKANQKFTVEQAIRLMDAPVAMKSNLHNVLMAPGLGKLWVAHASADKKPAWTQRYHELDFKALLAQPFPTTGGKELPGPTADIRTATN